jgi:hypothetical protein
VKDPSLPELQITDPTDIVVCVYCKKEFSKKALPYKQLGNNKYAHVGCAELEEKREKTDAEKLDEYIMKLCGTEYVPPRIRKQINSYINEYNYTYSGIHKALKYFYEIRHNSVNLDSIGIVPYIYNNARDYYYALWVAQQKNQDVVNNISDFIPKVREVHITPPERKVKKRELFSFLDEEDLIDE